MLLKSKNMTQHYTDLFLVNFVLVSWWAEFFPEGGVPEKSGNTYENDCSKSGTIRCIKITIAYNPQQHSKQTNKVRLE